MAPLPDNSTARVYLDYTSNAIVHTMQFRLSVTADVFAARVKAASLADVLVTRMFDNDSVIGARFSEAGSDIALPIAFTPVDGTITDHSQIWAEDPESAFLSFVGRGTATGRRVRWEFFTSVKTTSWPGPNRYVPGVSAPIDTLRENFEAWVAEAETPEQQVVTIGNDVPVVYAYVNIAKNAYWQREQR